MTSRTAARVAAAAGAGWLTLAVLAPGAALAVAPTKAGWFNALGSGGLAVPFPTTAEGDLHVGQGPTAPTAFAAVAYDVGPGVPSASLTLKITPNSAVGTVDLSACPTKTSTWKAGGNQPLDQAPEYDCTSAPTGLLAADGLSVTFLLDAPPDDSAYSLAVVPTAGSAPFQVDLTKPDASSLTPDTAVGGATTTEPAYDPGTGTSTPADTGSSGTPALGTGTVLPPPALTSGTGSAPTPELAGPVTTAPVASAPAPQTAGTPTTPVAARTPLAPVSNRERYVAGTLLALLAGSFVYALQQPSPTPRLLGGMARKGPAPEPEVVGATVPARGIGRFAAPRTAAARRLV